MALQLVVATNAAALCAGVLGLTWAPLHPSTGVTWMAAGVLAPLIAIGALRARFSFSIEDGAEAWTLHRGAARFTFPVTTAATVLASRLPFPRPTFELRLGDGRAFELRLELDPRRLPRHWSRPPSALGWFAEARVEAILRPREVWARYLLVPLVPAALLFRVHNLIAYGSPTGGISMVGPRAWALMALEYWAVVSFYVLLHGMLLRALVELVSLAAAGFGGKAAHRGRRWSEGGGRLLFYGGIAAALAWRFFG